MDRQRDPSRVGAVLPSVQPALPAHDQDDHRAADFYHPRGRHRRGRAREGRRPDGRPRDHLLRDRDNDRPRHRAGRGQHHQARRRREPADRPDERDHREAADLGPDPAPHRARVGDPRGGRRGRPSDRRLQHLLRGCPRHDWREGPAGRGLVRGGGGNDVQAHEHRDALRSDRRGRGHRLHGRARRARRAVEPGAGWWPRSTPR